MLLIAIAGIIVAIIGTFLCRPAKGQIFTPSLRLLAGSALFSVGLISAAFPWVIVLLWQQYHGG